MCAFLFLLVAHSLLIRTCFYKFSYDNIKHETKFNCSCTHCYFCTRKLSPEPLKLVLNFHRDVLSQSEQCRNSSGISYFALLWFQKNINSENISSSQRIYFWYFDRTLQQNNFINNKQWMQILLCLWVSMIFKILRAKWWSQHLFA